MSRHSNTLRAQSPGKLNLTFDILGDLPGGYHEVETLMQTIDLADELTFTFEPAEEFLVEITSVEFAGPTGDVPLNQNNLIAKAAHLFRKNFPDKPDYKVSVHLRKAVPVAGGMGGGSGNAAATLMVLNKWFKSPFSDSKIAEMASKLGADVPFFLNGGTQIGRHRGNVLSKVDLSNELHFLIVGPKLFGLQTAEVYGAFDENKVNGTATISATECAEALKGGDEKSASQKFGNVFEPIVFSRRPELQFIRNRLTELGGLCTHMTGSGPTLYVFTADKAEAESIQRKLVDEQRDVTNGWSNHCDLILNSWVATSTKRGVIVA